MHFSQLVVPFKTEVQHQHQQLPTTIVADSSNSYPYTLSILERIFRLSTTIVKLHRSERIAPYPLPSNTLTHNTSTYPYPYLSHHHHVATLHSSILFLQSLNN